MSDPVTNAEVEDVLSSIRRLVSEDKRPLHPPRHEPKADRLVLTPALRVADAPATDASLNLDDHLATDETSAEIHDTHLFSRYESRQQADIAQQEEAQQPEAYSAMSTTVRRHEEDYSADPYGFDDESDPDGEASSLLTTFPAVEVQEPIEEPKLRENTVSLRSNVDQQQPPAAKPVTQAAVAAEETPEAAPELAQADPIDDQEQVQDAAEPPAAFDVQSAVEASKSAALSAKIEALETAIGKIADSWEPDDAGEGDYAGSEPQAMEWEDNEPEEGPAARLHFSPMDTEFSDEDERQSDAISDNAPDQQDIAPHPEQDENVSPQGAGLELADDELLDEEALRDLVSEIVRAELQGSLGERITRNVRKLVRREIHRALAARDLE
jgi:hypothetical protein